VSKPKEEVKKPTQPAINTDIIFKNLTFVVTGEFDSISRDNIEALI